MGVEKMDVRKRRVKDFWVKSFLVVSALMLAFSLLPVQSSAAKIGDLDAEMIQIENELEFLFEEATTLVDGQYVLNEEATVEFFGAENLAAIEIFIGLINGETFTEDDFIEANLDVINEPTKGGILPSTLEGGISTFSWMGCLKEKIMIATGIGFISGGMTKLIDDKNWKKLSTEILKIVGKNAVKGGVVGLTASLAVWSVACIGK